VSHVGECCVGTWSFGSKTSLLDISMYITTHHIQGVPGGMCQTLGECSLS